MSRRIAQPVEINGNGLGPAEQESRARDQQNRRQKDGAHRIDVPERVEGHAPEPARGVVAELVGHEAVRCLVRGDRDHRGHGKGGDLERRFQRNFHG
jgi:hypothetical protein